MAGEIVTDRLQNSLGQLGRCDRGRNCARPKNYPLDEQLVWSR
jgi:hypothetical protein